MREKTHERGKRACLAQAEEAADSVISIDATGNALKAKVEKGPAMEPISLEFFGSMAQSTLENYAVL